MEFNASKEEYELLASKMTQPLTFDVLSHARFEEDKGDLMLAGYENGTIKCEGHFDKNLSVNTYLERAFPMLENFLGRKLSTLSYEPDSGDINDLSYSEMTPEMFTGTFTHN